MSEKKYCGGCSRFRANTRYGQRYNCACKHREDEDVYAEAEACEIYWDEAERKEKERKFEEAQELKRQQMWEKYSNNPPVKLPIVFDGYGMIPKCPTCGEMPYDTEQCHWCGQRFLQDEELEEYTKPKTIKGKCFGCGAEVTINVSRYNGHKSYRCEKCGMAMME